MKKVARVLITDLDNTLWDWVAVWHATFTGLIDVLVEKGGLDRETLLREAHQVHQRHRTSEYSRLLQELPSVLARGESEDVSTLKKEAISAAQEGREQALTLYPGVLDGLNRIRDAGGLVVAYTESMAFATSQRIRKLDLDGVIHFLYSSPDHDFPEGVSPSDHRTHADEYYQLKKTEHRHVERGVVKPNVGVLRKIMQDVGAHGDESVYLGDNLLKDISMAQDAGVLDVHAKYGGVLDHAEYELLRRVTHWTSEDVEREKKVYTDKSVTPTFTLSSKFDELFELFDFEPFEA